MGLQNNIHASEKTVYKLGTAAFLLSASAYFIRYLMPDDSDQIHKAIPKLEPSYKDNPNPMQTLHNCFSTYENDHLFIRLRSQQARIARAK